MGVKILTIIPARSGRPLNSFMFLFGTPLLPLFVHSYRYAQKSRLNQEIYLSTDSEEYSRIAKNFGIDVPFLRDSINGSDTAQDISFVTEAISKFRNIRKTFHYVCILRPTSPNRPEGLIEKAYAILEENEQVDSVRAVTQCSEHPYRVWKLDGSLIKPYISDIAEPFNLPRQILPKAYFQSGEIEMVRTSSVQNGTVTGNVVAPIFIKRDDVLDIDHLADFAEN